MSRPAVYLRVRNKAELLRAVGEHLLGRSLEQARSAASGPGSVSERLLGVLSAKLGLVLDLAARSEHAVELLSEYNRLNPDCAGEQAEGFEECAATVLADVMDRERARDAAAVLARCVRGLETDIAEPGLARARLRLLVELVARND